MSDEEVWNLCKLTLALALILGAGVYATNGRPKANVVSSQNQIEVSRTPASILKLSPSGLHKIAHSPNISTLDLKCLGQERVIRLNSKAQQMRLTGNNCQKLQGELTIRNTTNGFEASIFHRQQGFSSDYLALNKGTNAIQVSYVAEGQEKLVAELVITRQ